MTERVYISLKEASAYLNEKGLTEQSVNVLRVAIAEERLGAIKDGRSYKTTVKALEDYERWMWSRPRRFEPAQPGKMPVRSKPRGKRSKHAAINWLRGHD